MTAPPGRRTAAWLAIAFLASAALRWWLVKDMAGPAQFADEAGYLGNARWLAGEGPTWPMGRAPYYSFGYSLALVPIVRLVEDPALLHQLALAVNALLLAGLVPLLYALVHHAFGYPRRAALGAAAVGSLVPAAISQSAVAWSENLALPLFVVVLLMVWLATTERPRWQRWWAGPAVVWLYATHPRFTLVVPVVVVALVLAWVAERCPSRVLAANLAPLAVGVVVVRVVDDALQDARWGQVTRPEDELGLDRLLSAGGLLDVVGEAAGQAWYLAAGSCGLAVVGVIALVVALGRGRLRYSSRFWSAGVVLLLTTAAASLAVFVTSSLFFAFDRTRSDQLVYGRYNDAFVPVLVAIGVAHLATVHRRAALRGIAGAAVAVTALGAGLLVGRGTDAFSGPYVRPNIAAVARLIGRSPDQLVTRASGVALVALAVVALALVARRPWVAAIAVSAWFVVAAVSVVDGLDDYSSGYFDRWRLPDEVAELDLAPGTPIGFDRFGDALALGAYPFWLDELRLAPGEPHPFAFAKLGEPPEDGARAVLLDTRLGQALWVAPGPEAERLAGDGRLLPADFPAALPPAATRASVRLVEPAGTTIRLAPGSTADLTVVVGHRGAGSPWPDGASHGTTGVVRVGARWDEAVGAEGRAELPSWTVPGESATVRLEVRAVDDAGRPLAPGRYRLGVDLVQEGFAWFVAPGRERLRLDVVVTEPG